MKDDYIDTGRKAQKQKTRQYFPASPAGIRRRSGSASALSAMNGIPS